jgi:predicted HicB family RNase H-like nuclease
MAGKKVEFGKKPSKGNSSTAEVEHWVAARDLPGAEPEPEKMKRLTLDIPQRLHKAIKHRATEEGVTMADLLRALLEEKYGEGNSL